MLGDLYGPQRLLAEGVLPPALVYGNPGFLRPCRTTSEQAATDQPRSGLLQFYAADLVRGPDGEWRVLADRTGWPNGLAHALENRRRLGRILPELFASQLLCPLEHFAELWQDALHRLVPHADGDPGGVALLTPGHGDSDWFGHVLLARELSCALVECGDLTVRGGRLFLKTLRGLQPIGVLLRGEHGNRIDPLELAPDAGRRARACWKPRATAACASSTTPAPALPKPRLWPPSCPRWPGTCWARTWSCRGWRPTGLTRSPAMRDAVLRDPDAWLVRPALDGAAPPLGSPAWLPEQARQGLLTSHRRRAARNTWRAGRCRLPPRPASTAASWCRVRWSSGCSWYRWTARGTPCRAASAAPCPTATRPGRSPCPGLAKDVWVLAQDPLDIAGPPAQRVPALAIRRTAGDLPSRAADNFFWLGRYLERLEGAARLLRAALTRLARPSPAPHELAELQVLTACLTQAGVLNAETVAGLSPPRLSEALLRAAAPWGAIHAMIGRVSRMTGLLRDRVTGEMHAVIARGLRELEDALETIRPREDGKAVDGRCLGLFAVLVFSATVAGLAAENMVRGGGRLFLDLGRRVERAQAVADELACALELPGADTQPARVEHGLRLALELCDSVITYRSRYAGVLQPAPALDLMLADEGNPRGLAFQLVTAASAAAARSPASQDAALAGLAASLLAGGRGDGARVAAAAGPGARRDPAAAAAA